MSCDLWCFACLEFIGLCRMGLSSCLIMPHYLMWCIWQEQNMLESLRVVNSLFSSFKYFFFNTLLEWNLALPSFSCFSLLVLLNHCNFGSWFLGFYLIIVTLVLDFCPYSKRRKFMMLKRLYKQYPWIVSQERWGENRDWRRRDRKGERRKITLTLGHTCFLQPNT